MEIAWDGVTDFHVDEPLESLLVAVQGPPHGYTTPPPSALDIAAAFLNRLGSMDTIKLQKLCYYAQAHHLVTLGHSLFPDRIEAWARGPVVRSLYNVHRRAFSVSAISGGDHTIVDHTPAASATVTAIMDMFSSWSGAQLSEMTHREAPWLEARRGLAPGDRSEREITPESIAAFYRTIYQTLPTDGTADTQL